ncbi:SMP-30/gluconolactonase/LRE family protein [Agrobacterium tumefaciens]|uniref:SMP-30/gluconolactonase/LRE family protein n=1 Tax=Agrobacterium tumefaciens TaxID=358 RepID=A0AA44F6R3_AGRTU|nr:SMP-30/gluconolactonase/LRE family protein [Agrobacterium tumefaciens]NTB87533.1 SMP-30/gluconolactonase/LRE family protein [Agrobacterium tumefaciens]NTC17518.1 SMP-30/gluconolactonase/LRE family protein [Agrobacterium tumefaciens]NTC29700.1 SMP-30/gluconolactonase/LRE family protein [Agrobacterium tumefaciens]
MSDVFDPRHCELGEGALWHPERQCLFWFDILVNRLFGRDGDQALQWQFAENVFAAGWLSRDELLVASETGLWRLNLTSDVRERVAEFPAEPHLRSNDGRADNWIGTMGKRSEQEAGIIWRYYRGEMRAIYPGISIPNAVCFDAGRSLAYFADTRRKTTWHVRLDAEGWPVASPEIFLDLNDAGLSPDGALIDAQGNFWNAQWGACRVACYAPDGREIAVEHFAASRISCPAFGGKDLDLLFATSAFQGMSSDARRDEPNAGATFRAWRSRASFWDNRSPYVVACCIKQGGGLNDR